MIFFLKIVKAETPPIIFLTILVFFSQYAANMYETFDIVEQKNNMKQNMKITTIYKDYDMNRKEGLNV